jgi:hypothetical protein
MELFHRLQVRIFSWTLCSMLGLLAGCGSSDFGTVTGTVLAEGKPLPNAMVTFTPDPAGRPSSGVTDANGVYRLIYTKDQKGALIGPHTVRVSTAVAEGDYGKMSREKLPAKYNIASEIKKEVQPGRNVIDIEVDFKGKVIQPGY